MFMQLVAMTGSATNNNAQNGGLGSMLLSLAPIILVMVLMYFMLIRPQNKKRKEEEKMRSDLRIGDEITTIGGIVGRVIGIKEETLIIETGADRNKMQIKKWAVGSCDTVHDED
jgi:preprotein translocase subunit YajC